MLLNDKCVENAKAIKPCCMLDINPPPKSSSAKESPGEPKDKLREIPIKPNKEKTPNARVTNNFKGVKNRKEKSKGKESEFVKGQQVYYFPPKFHFLYNPKIACCGPFLISNIHSCGAIDIMLNDDTQLKVHGKKLKSYLASTSRTIWRPK